MGAALMLPKRDGEGGVKASPYILPDKTFFHHKPLQAAF